MNLNLAANLRELRHTDPSLAERIALPVSSDHTRYQEDGSAYLLRHETFVPFHLGPDDVDNALSPLTKESSILLAGVGVGELVDETLHRFPKSNVVAWERDPWILRQALSRRNYGEKIKSGQLQFAMAADLIGLIPIGEAQLVLHPILHRLYRNEIRLLKTEMKPRRALICDGTLFVDDVSDALWDLGFSVFTWDIQKLSTEELDRIAEAVAPEFVVAINHTHGLNDACFNNDLKLIVWEIDPATDIIKAPEEPTTSSQIFTYRRAHCPIFMNAGFSQVEYLPLAANPKRRRPLELQPEDMERYAAPISFVGASMVGTGQVHRDQILSAYSIWSEAHGGGGRNEGEAILDSILASQRKDYSQNHIPRLAEEALGPFLKDFRDAIPDQNPLMLLGEMAAADKRLFYLANLGPASAQVWGDEGWKFTEEYGVSYRGTARHGEEITKIYNASSINLDVGRLYQNDMVTMRVFDVLASGGFLLTEANEALEELFVFGKELVVYKDLAEMLEKVEYYLDRPQERQKIAAAGLDRIRSDHTITKRLRYMIDRQSPAS